MEIAFDGEEKEFKLTAPVMPKMLAAIGISILWQDAMMISVEEWYVLVIVLLLRYL